MLMLITESPPIGVEPDGILYRTPDELAHTDANTPVAVVIDLASPSLAFLEWVANRTRITIWLSPLFPTPEHQSQLHAPGVDGATFINWLYGCMAGWHRMTVCNQVNVMRFRHYCSLIVMVGCWRRMICRAMPRLCKELITH